MRLLSTPERVGRRLGPGEQARPKMGGDDGHVKIKNEQLGRVMVTHEMGEHVRDKGNRSDVKVKGQKRK